MILTNPKKYRVCSVEIRGEFKKGFSEALRRRLTPNTALHSDQLAYALGYEGATIRNWLRGEHEPSGAAVAATIQFFYSQGDEGFLAEVMPGVTPLVQRPKEDAQYREFFHQFQRLVENSRVAA